MKILMKLIIIEPKFLMYILVTKEFNKIAYK